MEKHSRVCRVCFFILHLHPSSIFLNINPSILQNAKDVFPEFTNIFFEPTKNANSLLSQKVIRNSTNAFFNWATCKDCNRLQYGFPYKMNYLFVCKLFVRLTFPKDQILVASQQKDVERTFHSQFLCQWFQDCKN